VWVIKKDSHPATVAQIIVLQKAGKVTRKYCKAGFLKRLELHCRFTLVKRKFFDFILNIL
jgi:hypothetical protein